MSDRRKETREYRSSLRAAGAARTRAAVLDAAAASFAGRGWAGTTITAVAAAASVSPKTVEAVWGTKAALLAAAVDYAIRGDVEPAEMPQRPAVAAMRAAPDATAFLDLHARHIRTVNARSAGVAWAVEQAAAEPAVAPLWERMNGNRAFAVRFAATELLAKPGRRSRLRRREVEATFWTAIDWSTYRTLTRFAGLDDDAFESWLRGLYRAVFL